MKPMGPIPREFTADAAGGLSIGGLPFADVAEGATPAFAYDLSIVQRRVEQFRAALGPDIALHYAVKANPWRPLLQRMAEFFRQRLSLDSSQPPA